MFEEGIESYIKCSMWMRWSLHSCWLDFSFFVFQSVSVFYLNIDMTRLNFITFLNTWSGNKDKFKIYQLSELINTIHWKKIPKEIKNNWKSRNVLRGYWKQLRKTSRRFFTARLGFCLRQIFTDINPFEFFATKDKLKHWGRNRYFSTILYPIRTGFIH